MSADPLTLTFVAEVDDRWFTEEPVGGVVRLGETVVFELETSGLTDEQIIRRTADAFAGRMREVFA